MTITPRIAYKLHGLLIIKDKKIVIVIKSSFKKAMNTFEKTLLDTIACGESS